jgi:hypothetical protein
MIMLHRSIWLVEKTKTNNYRAVGTGQCYIPNLPLPLPLPTAFKGLLNICN